jgi:tetratricopeptide (TPR) repeat protein
LLRNLVYQFLITVAVALCGCGSRPEKAPDSNIYYQWGEYLYYYNKKDSAFRMFSQAVNTSTDSIEKAKAYSYMGIMQQEIGDPYGAQENLIAGLKALDVKNEKQRDIIASLYNTLGNTSFDLKKYDEAIGFYNTALAIAKDKSYILEILNGKATALQRKKSYTEAIVLYDSILSLKPADVGLSARAISNRAKTKWLQNSDYPPLKEYHQALKIRTDSQISLGLNASYAQLSDYYAGLRNDSALFYASKMYQNAKAIASPDDVLEGVDKLIRLNTSSESKEFWYKEFRKLNDSIQIARDTTKSQFALIKYDVQKSKADNLSLQQHITRQRILMYGSIGLAIIVVIGLSMWYTRRRKRLKLESEKAIRESKLKTSQKIHDVVANGLYRIMNELEHGNTLEKEPLLDKIEGLYEQSRDISYEHLPENNATDDKQVYQLLTAFANEHTKVIVVGNQQTFWNKISTIQKYELQLVLNEIMINMQKHSAAKNVVIHFKIEKNTASINYKDDGVGFLPGIKFGNGLNNTVSRIKSLNGRVNFEKSGGQGVSIMIDFQLGPH